MTSSRVLNPRCSLLRSTIKKLAPFKIPMYTVRRGNPVRLLRSIVLVVMLNRSRPCCRVAIGNTTRLTQPQRLAYFVVCANRGTNR